MTAYLDNSATTKPCKGAKENMLKAIDKCWGNPSSLHSAGIDADMLLIESRRVIAKTLACDEKEIVFTSGGTESNNIAVFGSAYQQRRKGNKIITSAIEHPSVHKCFDKLADEGFEVVKIPVDSKGLIDLGILEKEVDENTVLVSIMAVNNEVGTIEPVNEIRNIVKRKNSPAIIHVDAVQVAFTQVCPRTSPSVAPQTVQVLAVVQSASAKLCPRAFPSVAPQTVQVLAVSQSASPHV